MKALVLKSVRYSTDGNNLKWANEGEVIEISDDLFLSLESAGYVTEKSLGPPVNKALGAAPRNKGR